MRHKLKIQKNAETYFKSLRFFETFNSCLVCLVYLLVKNEARQTASREVPVAT